MMNGLKQLQLLTQVTEMNDVEELVKTLLSWQLLQEQEAIIHQRQKNIEAEKRTAWDTDLKCKPQRGDSHLESNAPVGTFKS